MTRRQNDLKEMEFGVCIMVIRLCKGATRMLPNEVHDWVNHESSLIFTHYFCIVYIKTYFHIFSLTAELIATDDTRIARQSH